MLAIARQRAAEQTLAVDFQRRRRARARVRRSQLRRRRSACGVLMHTPRVASAASAELCRVAERLVILDYPVGDERGAVRVAGAARRCTPRESAPSRTACSLRPPIIEAFERNGFRLRSVHRQFVLPIALHKAIGSRRFTLSVRTRARPRRTAASRSVRRSRSSPNGARPSHRRDGVHRRPSRPRAGGARRLGVGALVRTESPAAAALATAGVELVDGRPARPAGAGARRSAASTCVYHIAAIYRQAGLSPRGLPRGERHRGAGSGRSVCARRRAAVRALQHGRRPRRRRASAGERGRAAEAGRHLSGDEARRGAARARGRASASASRSTIVRPTGIYGPGDRRLLKLFRGVARRRWITLGGGEIYYHLTYIDDLVDGFRLCANAAGGRQPHLHPGRRGGDDAERAGGAGGGGRPACRRRRVHLPVWPFWAGGRGVRGDLRAVRASSRRSTGGG